MSLRRPLAFAAAVALASPCAGPAQAGPLAKEIKKQYWQALPGIRGAAVDARGDVWLSTYEPCRIEDSYGKDFRLMSARDVLLLGDRKGRLWLNRPDARTPTRVYDGTRWQELGFRASAVVEDAAGRVFCAGPTHFHVLDGDRWSKHGHHDKPCSAAWRMLAEPAGCVWVWSYSGKPPSRPPGAWVWRKGAWTHHTTAGGFPFDQVEMVAPLAGGRYLVTTNQKGFSPNFVVWAWRDIGGREVPKRTRHDFLPDVSAHRLGYQGVDNDGNHFFAATGLMRSGQLAFVGDTVAVYFTPAGAGHVLTRHGAEFFRRVMRDRGRLYFSLKDRSLWDGRRLRRAPVGNRVLCVDRLGRIFSLAEPSREVQVLWPACERPGDLLRATRPDDLGIGRAFQYAAGGIWLRAGSRLLRWADGKWQATPIERKGHPPWIAEPAPPWNSFARGLHVVPGRGGRLLVINVRDIYQDIAPDADGKWPDHRAIWRKAREARAPGQPQFWLEGWLWQGGKWSGPAKVLDLVREERATFRKHFTVQTPDPSYFDLQSDGEHVWVAFGGTVRVFARGGREKVWQAPPGRYPQALPLMNLVCLPGGKTWCLCRIGERLEATAMSVSEGRIREQLVPAAGMEASSYAMQARYHASRGGVLWRWNARGASGFQALRARSFAWQGGAWHERKDLCGLVFEDDDGSLWFARRLHTVADRGYAILRKNGADKLDWPAHLPMGAVTRTRGRYLASCGSYVVEIEPPGEGKARTWKIGRVHLLQGAREQAGVFLDGRGHVVGASGWSAEFPADPGK